MLNLSTSVYCPFCRQMTSLQIAPVAVREGLHPTYVGAIWECGMGNRWWIGVCNYCHSPMLVRNDGDTIYPQPLPEPSEESIPEAIRSDLDEAKKCFSLSAFRGCAVLARRAMQSAALNLGAADDKLQRQIEELFAKSLITKDLKEWADVVRWVGNDAAHPGGDDVTDEDAEDILKLTSQFLHVLYVAPAIAKSLRGRKGKL